MNNLKARTKAGFLLSGIIFWVLSMPVLSSAERGVEIQFNIPAQDLLSALRLFQKQSDIDILFSPKAIVKVQSLPITGKYSVEKALNRLLEKTALTYTRNQAGFILIFPKQEEQAPHIEDAQPDDALRLEEIMITGYRSSLREALKNKKHSKAIADFISDADIGELPDVTIADALARISSLGAERDRGQASTLSFRGFGPRFGYASVNGREIVTAEDDRSIRYEQFPSELVYAAKVSKSYSSDMVEGGISGSIDLQTLRPLAINRQSFSLSGGYLNHPTGKTLDVVGDEGSSGYRFSSLYADQYDEGRLGIVIGFTAQEQPVTVNGLESFGFGGDVGDVNQDGVSDVGITGFDVFAVRGINERQGLLASIAWQPSEAFTVSYDYLYTLFDIRESTAEFFTFNSPAYNYLEGQVVDNNVLAGSIFFDSSIDPDFEPNDESSSSLGAGASFASLFTRKNQFWVNGLKFEWVSDDWRAEMDIGYSSAKRDSRFAAIQSSIKTDTVPYVISYDFRNEPAVSSSLDLSDPSIYKIDRLLVSPDRHVNDKNFNVAIHIKYSVNQVWLESVEWGVRLVGREKRYRRQNYSQLPIDRTGDGIVDELDLDIIPSLAGSVVNGSLNLPRVLSLDFDTVANVYFGGVMPANQQMLTNLDLIGTGQIKECSYAAYMRLDMQGQIRKTLLTGDIGARIVQTNVDARGFQRDMNDLTSPVTNKHRYLDLLPALNVRAQLSDDWILRFSAARTLSRPPLSELAAGVDLTNESSGFFLGSNGNTKLNPYRANQLDLSVEWYFAAESIVSFTAFWKDLQSSIARRAVDVNTPDGVVSLLRPVNTSGGKVKGLELAYQQPFRNLVAPFNRLGFSANYAFTDSGLRESTPEDITLAFAGLSRHAAFASLYYSYWPLEIKVGYNYRSAYTRQFREDLDLTTNDAESVWDLNISYDATDHFRLVFQAQNLGNYKERSYFLANPSNLERYREFSRRYFVGFQADF